MTSQAIRDPLADHLITPQNAALAVGHDVVVKVDGAAHSFSRRSVSTISTVAGTVSKRAQIAVQRTDRRELRRLVVDEHE